MLRKKKEKGEEQESLKKPKGKQKYQANLNDGKLITFVILGDKHVGKTALISRYVLGSFSPSYSPTVEECYFKLHYDKNRETNFNLRIIDTSGYYHFPAMQRLNMVHADVILLAYEVRNLPSMKRLIQLYSTAKEELKGHEPTPIICVGSKIDKNKDINNYYDEAIEEFIRLNKSACLRHILTSAKLDINVTDIFQLGIDMLQDLKMQKICGNATTSKFYEVIAKMKRVSSSQNDLFG